jgi:non-ribosomal peptide synthase protein (TIGR01720 family)
LKEEYQYWKRVCDEARKTGLNDNLRKPGKLKDTKENMFTLSEKESKALLEEVNEVYQTEINDILLGALSLAIKDWKRENKVLLNLEGHGREEVSAGMDVTRTVGWFTSQYPVVLKVWDNVPVHIMETKEQLRKIPKKGIGYGILRYISDLAGEEKSKLALKPEISFNYLGQFENEPYSFSASMSEESEQLFGININGIMAGGKVVFRFNWDRMRYKEEDIRVLVESCERRLKEIIGHCREKEEIIYTPSDFDARNLDFEEINDIKDMLL